MSDSIYYVYYMVDKVGFRFDVEVEDYSCEIPSDNGQYCSTWFTLEHSTDEFEIGNATCTEESTNNQYCQSWYISQLEYKRCWKELDLGSNSQSIILCCNEDNKGNYCCQNACSPSFYDAYEPTPEFTECYCEVPSSTGRFCLQWHCEEYNDIDWTFSTGREFETYTCLEYGGGGAPFSTTDDANSTYCQRWKGEVDSISQFELSRCNCTRESANGQYCMVWQCDEKGGYYWWPNTLWILFTCLLGGVAPLVLIRWMCLDWTRCNTKPDQLWHMTGRSFLVFFFWICPFAIIGIWKAGLIVLLFCLLIDVLPTCIIFGVCFDNQKRLADAQGDLVEVQFNWFYTQPEKITLADACYVSQIPAPTTVNTSAMVGASELLSSDMDGESAEEAVTRSTSITVAADLESTTRDNVIPESEIATAELCVPQGGFEIECPFSSSSSSGSYDEHQLSIIGKLLSNISSRYTRVVSNNPFSNATTYYTNNHRENYGSSYHYGAHSAHSLNSSDNDSDDW